MLASFERWRRSPVLHVLFIIGLATIALKMEGRRWWCECGQPFLWSGNIRSQHNSQHLLDPYSFTHVLHGLILYAVLRPFAGRLGSAHRFSLAVAVEAFWEVLENTPVVIERYRRATLALGYVGDSVANSLADIVSCMVGYWLAARLPTRWSIALFVAVEASLLVLYRDSLGLSILMLFLPSAAIREWQTGG